ARTRRGPAHGQAGREVRGDQRRSQAPQHRRDERRRLVPRMSTLRQALYGFALLGALALLLWGQHQHSQAEQGRTALAEERLRVLQERSARQSATIIRLGGEVHAQRLGQQSLQDTLDGLRLAQSADQLKKKEQ